PSAKMLFIGGDHSITPIITKALNVRSYLCLDAHFDLMKGYNKDKDSHACANRRVYEQKTEMHLRGIRSGSKEEHEFGDSSKIDWRRDIGFNGRVDYFSLDADVMDPAYVGTGTPEALGFTPEQIISTIRNTEFRYFDFVEWMPDVGYAYAVQIIKEVLFK
ncbi:arginase family protein, partial [Candidatus Micrarchaeota archaeon]|nr:arginase family protein [Candidatus Micrarchaeota archaeon]